MMMARGTSIYMTGWLEGLTKAERIKNTQVKNMGCVTSIKILGWPVALGW